MTSSADVGSPGAPTGRATSLRPGGVPGPTGRRSLEWPAVAVLALAAFGLGIAGFLEHRAAAGEPRSLLGVVYLSLQLFVLESGAVAGPTPWELEVARFLAPGVAVYTAVKALAVVFREQLERFRLRFLDDHAVVCGLGQKGFLLARSLLRRGDEVVVVEKDAENDFIGPIRAAGAPVLLGDARDPALLGDARLLRARHLVAVSGSDGVNAEIIAGARQIVSEGAGDSHLSCRAHVDDPRLCSFLRMREVAEARGRDLRVDFFNVRESGARTLLREHPPAGEAGDDGGADGGDGPPPGIVVIGLGSFGESVVVEAARQHRADPSAGDTPLRIDVVDPAAGARLRSLRERHPEVDGIAELVPHPVALDSAAFQRADFLRGSGRRIGAGAVYVCADDDSVAFSAGLALHRHLRTTRIPVVIRMDHDAGVASLLSEEEDEVEDGGGASLHIFGLLDRTCRPELLFAGVFELLARAIHGAYLGMRRREGRPTGDDPALAPWEELPEPLRESSRAQAAHIGVKLEAVGCELVPLAAGLDEEPVHFTDDEVELLARMEHARWVEERRRSGWTEGERDPEARTSPYLVDFEELPPDVADYDRTFARRLPHLLAQAGFRIVRSEGSP